MASITLVNNTREMVRLALFKTPVLNPNLAPIAWRIASPPPGGSTKVILPSDFTVQAHYSGDPSNPSHLENTTVPVAFSETTAGFSIDSINQQATRAVIRQVFTDLAMNAVRVVNNFPIAVEVSIRMGDDPIYEPRMVWPGGVLMEDIRGSIYVAVVSQFTMQSLRLLQEEFSLTQTEVIAGGRLQVTGSQWKGYALTAL